jgi:hypothetical protein
MGLFFVLAAAASTGIFIYRSCFLFYFADAFLFSFEKKTEQTNTPELACK